MKEGILRWKAMSQKKTWTLKGNDTRGCDQNLCWKLCVRGGLLEV